MFHKILYKVYEKLSNEIYLRNIGAVIAIPNLRA
jgi:hypothetical protein